MQQFVLKAKKLLLLISSSAFSLVAVSRGHVPD